MPEHIDPPRAKEKVQGKAPVPQPPLVDQPDIDNDDLLNASVEEARRDPNFLTAFIERAKNNPALVVMAKQNTHSAKMAAKAKAGKMLLTRIRDNLIRPALPEQYRGVLDSPLVCGVIDLAIGNMLLFAGVQFQDKLPVKMRPYATLMGEAATYSAYNDTIGGMSIEHFFAKIVSGDLFDMFRTMVEEPEK